jgi:hypothetical protein
MPNAITKAPVPNTQGQAQEETVRVPRSFSFRGVRWALTALVALSAPAVFAQQESASSVNAEQRTEPAEAPQAKAEEGAKTGETAHEETGASARAQEEGKPAEKERQPEEAKVISGMSILGNQEAPKSLVIVPWKSSELGGTLGVAPMLDDSRQPVDKDVFMRALSYYEIRSETKR